MAKIGRPGLPSEKRRQVWDRWKAGDSISVIAKAVGSPAGSIYSILLPFGGIYQAPQRRRAGSLSRSEREEISRGFVDSPSSGTVGNLTLVAPTGVLMRKSKFTESQIVAILREAEASVVVADLLRKHKISRPTFYL